MCGCVCVWLQTRKYECKASMFYMLRCVCQRRVDTDESKLDGDGVHPVGGLIIMAAVLLIIPSTLAPSLYSSVSLSVSVSAVSFLPSKTRWVVVVLAWHTPFCLLSFSTSLTASLCHTNPHLYPSSYSHRWCACVCVCTQLLIPFSPMRHIVEQVLLCHSVKNCRGNGISFKVVTYLFKADLKQQFHILQGGIYLLLCVSIEA